MTVVESMPPVVEHEERNAGIVDCDVHTAFRSREVIKEYLPEKWHPYRDLGQAVPGHAGITVGALARPSVFRMDTFPPDGVPGSDLGLMRSQLLDPFDVRAAILHPILETLTFVQYGEFGLALAAATNDWLAAEFLSRDDRLYGAVSVPIEDGILAAEEIARVGGDRRFVKVLMTSLTREPLGHPKYWPIYEAAVAHELPIGVHVGGFSGVQSGAGWSSYVVELRANFVLGYVAQAVSLIYSGVFDRFPKLQFLFEEGGIAWVPAMMWRLDRAWSELGAQAPHLKERPSEVIRRHFMFATQPLDEPENDHDLPALLDQIGMDDRILFSSDYPHHDFDDPRRVLPAGRIGESRRRQIMHDNATAQFRFA